MAYREFMCDAIMDMPEVKTPPFTPRRRKSPKGLIWIGVENCQ